MAPVWFASGVGGDVMTGGTEGNTYLYTSVSDSGRGSAADTITNFNAATDEFDFSDITALTNVQGLMTTTSIQISGNSIAWGVSSGNTLVYANDTTKTVSQSQAHMEIVLNGGNIGLTNGNFIHH